MGKNLLPDIKRILILGHSGFVGQRLKEYFQTRYPAIDIVGISSREIDLTQPQKSMTLSEYFDLDTAVIMCSGIKSNYGTNLETYAKNVAMVQNVCRVLAKYPVRKFVFFSSIAVYGVDKHDVNITEQTEIIPDTHYGLSKYDSEKLLSLEFKQLKQSSLIILRTPTIYGPNEKIIASTPSGFLTTYLRGGQVTLWGDGSDLREFLFIEDLIRIIDFLLQGGFSGVLNVSSGCVHSYREAVDIIAHLLDKELTVNYRERTKPKVDKVYNTSFLKSLLPQFSFTPLEKGLQHILDGHKLHEASPGVFVSLETVIRTGQREIDFIKSQAAQSVKRRARIRFHKELDAPVQEMIIAARSDGYIIPHKHDLKSESFQMIEGEMDVLIFNEGGALTEVIEMGGDVFNRKIYCRIPENLFHTIIIRSECAIFLEVTDGPFRKEETIVAPWAPQEGDTAGIIAFMETIKRLRA
jgi:UDP-glucose 4-epimerase